MRKFLQWWILFLLQLSLIGICQYFNLLEWVWNNDATKISILILGLWLFATIQTGFYTYKYEIGQINKKTLEKKLEDGWFVSDQCLSLGMLGTVIGFLLMMGSITTSTDVDSIKTMLGTMSSGMGTALITTAIGMILGNAIKLELFLMNRE